MNDRHATRVGRAAGFAPAPGIGEVPAEGTANERQEYRSPDPARPVTHPAHFPDLSAKHADTALGALSEARTATDSREREHHVSVAKVLASLSLRDKIDQLEATISHAADALLASQAKLDSDVQLAAHTLHADARDLRARLRVIHGGDAA